MARIRIRRDLAAQWTSFNPILGLGEAGIETDTYKMKVGDGVTAWDDLLYININKGDQGEPGVSPEITMIGDQVAVDGVPVGPNLTGVPGEPGVSPEITMIGDQVAVDGLPVGPNLTGPPGDTGQAGESGRYDILTALVATNGGTSTLDYSLGNTFTIDATALAAGNAFTVAINNLPEGSVLAAVTLILTTGTNIPAITWPSGITAPTLQASKTHWYTLVTTDNGATIRLFESGVF